MVSLNFWLLFAAGLWAPVRGDVGQREQLMCFMKEEVRDFFEFLVPLPADASCAVVSASGALLRHHLGPDIEQHDYVFRFNDNPTEGYEEYVGSQARVRNVRFGWGIQRLEDGEGVICYGKDGEAKIEEQWGPTAVPMCMKGGNVSIDDNLASMMETLYPTRAGFHRTDSNDTTTGFTGMLIALSNCAKVDAYEMTPSDAAKDAPYDYTEAAGGGATDNSWHGYFRAEHELWANLTETPRDEWKSSGRTSYPGFGSVLCPDGVPSPGSLEQHAALRRLLRRGYLPALQLLFHKSGARPAVLREEGRPLLA